MRYEELIRKLRRDGWELRRHGARHDIYTKADGRLIIPRHQREVPTGLAERILKDAGLK